MQSRRLARLNEFVQQAVSKLTLQLKDPGLGFVTITGTKISADVSLAKIFYSVLGTAKDRELTKEALERAKPHLRSELAKMDTFRRVPQLMFVYDDGIDYAYRVNQILHTIEDEKKNDAINNPTSPSL